MNTKYPKVIYFCNKTIGNNEIISSNNWKILNPDYEIKLYDDDLCQKFLLEEYSQLHSDIFNFIPDGPIKADFWRVCIINKYGGLYVDADINPIVSLSNYVEKNDDFVSCISMYFNIYIDEWQLNPHIILSDKNNYYLYDCMNKYIELYKNHKEEYNYWNWSICRIMKIPYIKQKKSQILLLNNQKYKFLIETDYNTCKYNDEIVLYNRYDEYVNHDFV